MVIRKAAARDAAAINRLAESLRVDYDREQPDGFLVYMLTENGYKRRIETSSHFYVASEKGKVDGFLMCFDNFALRELRRETLFDHEDRIVEVVSQKQEPFIFGDQIGVREGMEMRGLGRSLMSYLFDDMRRGGIPVMYVAVLHEPRKNMASIEFCQTLGFNLAEEVYNSDNHLWGIYGLKLF